MSKTARQEGKRARMHVHRDQKLAIENTGNGQTVCRALKSLRGLELVRCWLPPCGTAPKDSADAHNICRAAQGHFSLSRLLRRSVVIPPPAWLALRVPCMLVWLQHSMFDLCCPHGVVCILLALPICSAFVFVRS